ncbi:MAG: hypothetical protein DRZ82_08800 [Thermoprotei archaeon]|nr:MAG: hypothetical protein DRZ82_08800 [Thermoprotei archaeon]
MLREKLTFILEKLPWYSYIRAIIAGETIDYFERYLYVVRLLLTVERRVGKKLKLLEVGAGSASPVKHYFEDVILLDITPNVRVDIVADATHLPLRDKAFDVVVAIDLLEHIPLNRREFVLNELLRVAKLVIIHTPLVSKNGLFNARFYDYLLLKFLESKLESNPSTRFTMEHLKYGEPEYEVLREKKFKLVGYDWSARIWYCIMKIQLASRGIMSRLIWLIYLLLLKHLREPPYYGGFLILHHR